jgi:hypothetical protein
MLITLIGLISGFIPAAAQTANWLPELTETWEPVPESVNPAPYFTPPSDAIQLLGENYLSNWEDADKWNFENGVLTVEPGTGGIQTAGAYSSIQLYMEWRIPQNVDGEDQRRGNSGIFLQGLYEVQILDSYNNATYTNGQAGAVYKQYPPLVNASLPPGEWQSYHIIFNAPVFAENGSLARPAYLTVFHNGVLIQNHVEVKGPTILTGLPQYEAHPYKLPLFIQGSRHGISFRNIWIREI